MSFQNISGHTKEIRVLKNAIQSNRVAHSYLFAGPEGVGKRLAALAFAAALNCVEGDGDSCGACGDCALMANGTHPNLMEIWPSDKDGERSPDGLIRIDRIRDVQNAVKYRVDRGKKAVIVDSADRMMPAAANAFLKTLEEPPADTVIILITSRPADLLPTILSRCQRVNFRPLSAEEISSFLAGETGVSDDDARAAARLSGGSVSKALSLIGEGSHQTRKEIIERLSAITSRDIDIALKFAEDLSKRDDLVEILEFMKTWYRDKLVTLEGAGQLAVNSDMAGHITHREGRMRLMESFSMIEKARRDIMPPRYSNKQLTMEVLLMGLMGLG